MRAWMGIALLAVGCTGVSEPSEAVHGSGEPVPGLVVVDFVDGTTKAQFDALESEFGLDLEFNSIASEEAALTIAQATASAELLARLRAHPLVEAAEPAFEMKAFFTPDDPDYRLQWHFAQVGADRAWEWGTGRDVIVAVIDTGVSRLDDFAATRFAPGWDFVDDDADPTDEQGHGTHVAGTIAQSTHNTKGVAGLAHGATLMPVRVLDARGSGHTADIADGIRWATKHGAKVINLSLGGFGRSAVLEDAVRDAVAAGVVVVCAAGNGFGPPVAYPAAYDGAFAVSAVRFDRALAPYSSFGPQVDLAAPGGDKNVDQNGDGKPDGVLQQVLGGGYDWYQGTSMASPHVAAAAALVAGAGVTRAQAIQDILRDTASKAGPADRFGAGVLDAHAAVKRVRFRGGFWRLAGGALFSILALGLVRRKDGHAGPFGVRGALGVVMATSGLALLPLVGFGHPGPAAFLATPIPEWGQVIHGVRESNPLWMSAFVPFVALGLSRVRLLSGLMSGVALGWAGYLVHAAVTGWVDVAWMPGRSVEAVWLVANAALAFALGVFALRRPRGFEDL